MFFKRKRPAHRNLNPGVQVSIEIDMNLPLESIPEVRPQPTVDLDGYAIYKEAMRKVNAYHAAKLAEDLRRYQAMSREAKRQSHLEERTEAFARDWANGKLDYRPEKSQKRQRVTTIIRLGDKRLKVDTSDMTVAEAIERQGE